MCAGCISTVDSYVYAGVVAVAAVEAGICRVRAMLDATYAAERPTRVWERNAAFCEYMGLEPNEVLGPKPAAPAVAAVPARRLRPVMGLAMAPA